MTPAELKTLIESDSEAQSAATANRWRDCADRASEIAPALLRESLLTELSILRLSDDPAAAESVLQQIEAVSEGNPVVARVLKWMQPGAPGLNFGDTRVRAMLTMPIDQGGCGLTSEQASPLLAVAEYQPEFTPAECRFAMTGV
jgi:hypothetical protein